MKNLKEFKPLWNFVKEYKVKLIIASILIFMCEFSEILVGYLNGAAVEAITNVQLQKALLYLSIYWIGNILMNGVLSTQANSMLQKIESAVSRKLGFFTYKKALDLPAYAYEKTSSGEIINRITNDADALSFSFGQLLQIFSSLIGSIVLIVYIFFNSWIIGLEILFFVLVLFLIIKKYHPILKAVHKERKKEHDNFTSLVTESIRGVREIKTLGVKKNLVSDMIDVIKNIFKKSEDEINIRKKFHLLTRFLKATLEVGVFITCAVLLYYKKTTLTFFIAMTYYIYRYMWLVENLNNFTQTYQRVVVSLGRVNEILENKLYQDEQFGIETIEKTKGIVEFKDVTFSYPDEDIILNHFHLKLEPNKKIAIVGKSGQGKSTLFNLMTRVFEPLEGEILLDGINIKQLTEESLRKHISIIRQEPFIFNRTIEENFQLINNDITLEDIRKYSKTAYLDDYIMSLPNGYQTRLGEGGVNLSGGQKQRLAIARTLAKESKVILFDEATSALDNQSQDYIKKAIDQLVKNHTVVIVAHRLSTIMDADIIHVVEHGHIIASGTHQELLKKCVTYQNLYETESTNS